MNHLVAVYGSLREGMHNHRLLERGDAKLIGEFKTKPEYTMFSLGSFPGVSKKGKSSIVLEVYEVDDDTLENLDSLEGYRKNNPKESFYIREVIDTPFGESYIYLTAQRKNTDIVESGDWKKYHKY